MNRIGSKVWLFDIQTSVDRFYSIEKVVKEGSFICSTVTSIIRLLPNSIKENIWYTNLECSVDWYPNIAIINKLYLQTCYWAQCKFFINHASVRTMLSKQFHQQSWAVVSSNVPQEQMIELPMAYSPIVKKSNQ